MNSAQFKSAIAALDLDQAAAAAFLGVSLRTCCNYMNGGAIPDATAKLLRLMVRLKLKPENVK